jgi:hypothetical protein
MAFFRYRTVKGLNITLKFAVEALSQNKDISDHSGLFLLRRKLLEEEGGGGQASFGLADATWTGVDQSGQTESDTHFRMVFFGFFFQLIRSFYTQISEEKNIQVICKEISDLALWK